jgi:hypothetical protein
MPSESVKVFARFRPFNARERKLNEEGRLNMTMDGGAIVVEHEERVNKFAFDNIFDETSTQLQVFEEGAKHQIEDIFQGYNGTIFAYGQTGSGKTWSMMGDRTRDDLMGIIPRGTQHIFREIAKMSTDTEFSVSCSYLEVYREQIRDLLDSTGDKSNLKIHEHPMKGIYVDKLTKTFVTSEDDVMDVLAIGDTCRAVASTNMNATSSRSHCVFCIMVDMRSDEGSTKSGKLNLVDLAGSEKISKTGAQGETLEEAKKINQSLSALGQVIKALSDAKGHVPYRDSKLTRLLQESLGGNCKTTLLIACSPHTDNVDETVGTLKFGQRAKTITNKVTVNEEKSAAELQAIIRALTAEVNELRVYCSGLEAALTAAGGDPAAVKVAAAVNAAASGDGADGGGGGGDAAAEAALRAQLSKTQELLRISQEETQEAQKEKDEERKSAEQAMAEGAVAKAAMEKMAAKRERETAIVMRAMSELQKLKKEKDGQLAHEERVQGEIRKARDDKAAAEDALALLRDEFDGQRTKWSMLEASASGADLEALQSGEVGVLQSKLTAAKQAEREAHNEAATLFQDLEEMQTQVAEHNELRAEMEKVNVATVEELTKDVHKLEEANYDYEEELAEQHGRMATLKKQMALGMSAAMKRSGGGSGGASGSGRGWNAMRRTIGGGGRGGAVAFKSQSRKVNVALAGAVIDVRNAAASMQRLVSSVGAMQAGAVDEWKGALLANLCTLAVQFDDYCTCIDRIGGATVALTAAIEAFNASASEACSYDLVEVGMVRGGMVKGLTR